MNELEQNKTYSDDADDLCKKSFVLAIRDALNVVSGKWKLAIICTLLSGPKGFAEIERLLADISPRMLSRELRELEVNEVIVRPDGTAGSTRHKKYELTASGRRLDNVIFMMASWGESHRSATQTNPRS